METLKACLILLVVLLFFKWGNYLLKEEIEEQKEKIERILYYLAFRK